MIKDYSGVEHLAKTLLLSRWWGSVWVFMTETETSAYFDESRVDGSSPFPVVAGFWSPVDKWIVVERRFRTQLKNKPKGMKAKQYVRAHPGRFSRIVNACALVPFYVVIEHSYFESHFHEGHDGSRPWMAGAYALCASASCLILNAYAEKQTVMQPVKVVYDDGAPHKVHFERAYRAFVEMGPAKCISPTPNSATEEEAIPLLAADLYAWLLSRSLNHGNMQEKEIQALKRMEKVAPQYLELTKDNIEQYTPNFLGELLGDDATLSK